MASADLSITVLPYRLAIASVPSSDTGRVLDLFLKHMAFPSSAHRVDELKEYPDMSMKVSTDVWRAIQIVEGSFGYTSTGIVQSISAPLAEANISIMNLSTFETDFALVKEHEVQKAVEVLQSRFSLLMEGVEDLEESVEALEDCSEIFSRQIGTNDKVGDTVEDKMKVRVRGEDLFLGKLSRKNPGGSENILAAVRAAFCSKGNDEVQRGLFSFTETEDEVSVIVDDKVKEFFDDKYMTIYPVSWRAMYIAGEPLGFNTSGIVSGFCAPLAKAKISLFYLSMFSTDVTLVESETLDNAISELDHRLFYFDDSKHEQNANGDVADTNTIEGRIEA